MVIFTLYLHWFKYFHFGIQVEKSSIASLADTFKMVFKVKEHTIPILFKRSELSERIDKNECVLSFKLPFSVEHNGGFFPFVVIPIKITAALELEQTGDAILCFDESHATEVRKEITLKNKNPIVVLMSWKDGFQLGTLENYKSFGRVLEIRPVLQEKVINGARCGFVLRIYDYYSDEAVLKWEEYLPVTDPIEADKLFHKKEDQMKAEAAELDKTMPPIDRDMVKSQLLLLSKSYPDTIAFFEKPEIANIDALFKAYQRETFLNYKTLNGSFDDVEFELVAKAMQKLSRRTKPTRDAIEYELVMGWRLRGYDKMTPQERVQHLRNLGLKPMSAEAVRKTCERLKLSTLRKPGSPQKK